MICFFLASVGLVTLVRLDMETAVRQLIWMAIALVVMFIVVADRQAREGFRRLNTMWPALGLLAFAFCSPRPRAARNWVSIGPVRFSPASLPRCCLSSYLPTFSRQPRQVVTLGYVAFAGCALSYCDVQRPRCGAAVCGHVPHHVFRGHGRNCRLWRGWESAAGAVASYYLLPHVRTRGDMAEPVDVSPHPVSDRAGADGHRGAAYWRGGPGYPDHTGEQRLYICGDLRGVRHHIGIITILMYLAFIIRGDHRDEREHAFWMRCWCSCDACCRCSRHHHRRHR